jgi:hypothetical protein
MLPRPTCGPRRRNGTTAAHRHDARVAEHALTSAENVTTPPLVCNVVNPFLVYLLLHLIHFLAYVGDSARGRELRVTVALHMSSSRHRRPVQ